MIKLHAFRIREFRSIKDTGFKEFSPDGISLLVGQNESGKTSVLEALNAFETGQITEDDVRSSGALPEITCIYKFESYEKFIEDLDPDISVTQLPNDFKDVFEGLGNCISLIRRWESGDDKGKLHLENETLNKLFTKVTEKETTQELVTVTEEVTTDDIKSDSSISAETLVDNLFNVLPLIVLFEENSLLPATIDLSDIKEENKSVPGYQGAINFLSIADLDIDTLLNPPNSRIVKDTLEERSKKVNSELLKYWNQTIGKKNKIELVVDLEYHQSTVSEKAGKPYLTFWIRDNNGRLSPAQRSQGVKWFISFYLTLEATAKTAVNRIFLIDEPGSNLHAKAQKDILSIFEKQKDTLQIIFTTHSPYLLDIDKVYRVLAVEREDTEDDKSETKIFSFQALGSATTDTLLPLYSSMGIDVSHQNVIAKENNILLEEISAFFYLKAFWELFNRHEVVNFLPATGCTNVPLLANLMLGWGLSFGVVLDDEPHGRKVLKELKENCVVPEEKLIKIKDCKGIEDLFTNDDFSKNILGNSSLAISIQNSDYMQKEKISKVITARNFLILVQSKKIKTTDFSEDTTLKIKALLDKIASTLSTSSPLTIKEVLQ